MRKFPVIVGTLAACIALQVHALAFSLKTVPLTHPANGDLVLLSSDPGANKSPASHSLVDHSPSDNSLPDTSLPDNPRINNHLAVSGHAADGRWLSVINLENFSARTIAIPTQAQFFSAMQLSGHTGKQLVFHTTEGVSHYSLSNNTLSPLVKTSSIYALADQKRLRHTDMVVDVNNDGLSDLLIADFTRCHLWLQHDDGSFAHFPLTVDATVDTYEEIPRYSPRKPYLVDINLDGKTDIVFARDDQLLIFTQHKDGSFPEQARVYRPGMTISSDSEASLRPGDGRNYDGLLINRLFDVTDLDGDDLADIIIRREKFADALEQNYDYLIHYGRAGDEGLYFETKPDTRINTHGIQFESVFADIDGDGRKDFYTPSVHFGLGLMVRALISGNAGMEVQFYRMKPDRSFNEKPDHIHKTTASISISGGRVDLPLFQLAGHVDKTYKDLWVGEKQQRLIVNRSDEKQLFDRERLQFNVALPRDGSKVRVMDVNNDGQDDLVLPFDAQEKKELRNQVQFLIVK